MDINDFRNLASLAEIGSLYDAKDIEELKHIYRYLYMNCPYFLKDSLTSIYNMRKERFEREQLSLNELKKIDDVSKLVDGNYYFVFIGNENIKVEVSGPKNSISPIKKEIPVVTHYENGKLVDIISEMEVSFNALDAYQLQNKKIFADYVTQMSKSEMKDALCKLMKMSKEEKYEYKENIYKTYGIDASNYQRLLVKNNFKNIDIHHI